MRRKRIKRYKWLPPLLALGGIAFYVYDGLEMNSWMKNLPNLIIYFVIILALWWALRKKDKLERQRSTFYGQQDEVNENNNDNKQI